MKIKTFKARTFTAALDMVKKEMSKDAVILSTKEKKGLVPSVEITAGVDYEAAQRPIQLRKTVTQVSPPVIEPNKPALVEEIKTEIGSLRQAIESMKSRGYEVDLPEEKKMVLSFLRKQSVRDEYAMLLCEKAKDLDDIPLLLSSEIKVKRHTGMKKAVMLIGPTGVGKTTTIAKLAAQAIKNKKRACIVNLDTYRIGAVEQIRIYSSILGIPLATASTMDEFKQAVAKFSVNKDVIFIDTTGRNPRDNAYIRGLDEVCKNAGVPLELHLLMNANGDDEFMVESYRHYRTLPIDYLGFTKVDEAMRFGPLYNTMQTYQKPVAYLTNGQRVPGDIEYPTVNRLAGLIVSRECAPC
jgi:flagellar biosynthesis protein FlhF